MLAFSDDNVNKFSKVPQQAPLPRFDVQELEKYSDSPEVLSLLRIMNRFQVADIQLETKLKPFIPAYIPSIGEVDAFLKVHKPDRSVEDLGFSVLDEPTTDGVDSRILMLQLIDQGRNRDFQMMNIPTIENAEKKPSEIQDWIDKIGQLPKKAASVSYSKNMPDLESLMQLWPEKMESELNDTAFPGDSVKLPTQIYAKLICNLLDIPIYKANNDKSLIESLHVLFSLYSVVKEKIAFCITHLNKAKKTNY